VATTTDVNRTALTLATVEIDIAATRPSVWNLHTYVNAWSVWQPDMRYAVLEHPLAPGVSFRWSCHEREITSMVCAVEEGLRIVWSNNTSKHETGNHEWTFSDIATGVRVTTTESLVSPSLSADPTGWQTVLERYLTFWLRRLKTVAESR
jgi:hypothetical protein